ncbi:hypothetical protein N7465_002751 [Penicillium sp. CMV-2018d]|nr:hypothetical protein N7465_002751 [Penicillium sp. CMV-2018d]
MALTQLPVLTLFQDKYLPGIWVYGGLVGSRNVVVITLSCEILSEQDPEHPHKAAAPRSGNSIRGLKSGTYNKYG